MFNHRMRLFDHQTHVDVLGELPDAGAEDPLPDRDREAVIQGFKEDFLRKYGELIEAYYRALSDTSDE